jgi:CheY-like chemotaxis protein
MPAEPASIPPFRSIYVADDDADDSFLLVNALRQVVPDAAVTEFSNGSRLLQAMSQTLPDLIFLDLDMPGTNGLECIHSIREDARMQHTPSVVFSSTDRPGNIQAAFEIGADLFLVKPHTYSELVRSLERIMALDWSDREALRNRFQVNGQYVALL